MPRKISYDSRFTMDKYLFEKLQDYKKTTETAYRNAIPANSKSAISEYLNKRSISVMDERAKEFYAKLNASKNVQNANDKMASKIALKQYSK